MTALDAPLRHAPHRPPHRTDDPWRHILVVTDGGSASMAALARALELARRDHARVTIVAARPVGPPGRSADSAVPVAVDVMVERARAAGLEVGLLVRDGAVGRAIVDAAADLDADLIIIGRHGSRHELPAGSGTCGYVLTHTDRPVLVVQPWAPGGAAD